MPRARVSIYSSDYQWILKRLVELRQEAGLFQSDVALRMKTSQGNVSKLERGAMRLDLVDLFGYLTAIDYDTVVFVQEYVAYRTRH